MTGQKNIINLIVHPGNIEFELEKAQSLGEKSLAEKCERALSEIKKIRELNNTIIIEGDLKAAVEQLKHSQDCYIKIYGAYHGMCLSAVDIMLTNRGIPHEYAENGFI